MMTVGSLFAGIGGIELGLEQSGGFQTKWQVEKDPYALKILARHWPDAWRFRDVRYFLGGKRWRRCRAAWHVDLVCGGFPCQDLSNAGRRAGIGGARSGLWSEFARVLRLLRPRYVIVENVPALAIRGIERVVGDLAELGYSAEWDLIPAAALGAPHRRWRMWIVAYAPAVQRASVERGESNGAAQFLAAHPDSDGEQQSEGNQQRSGRRPGNGRAETSPHANGQRRQGRRPRGGQAPSQREVQDMVSRDRGSNSAHADSRRREVSLEIQPRQRHAHQRGQDAADAQGRFSGPGWREEFARFCEAQRALYWPHAVPEIRRMDDGLPAWLYRSPPPTEPKVPERAHRLRCLGNSVLPQIATYIGERILAWEKNASSSPATV